MVNKGQHPGLVLLCDHNGVIEKVIRNDFEDRALQPEGKPLSIFFSKETVPKSLDLILDIKKESIVFDRMLTVATGQIVQMLYFTGFYLEKKIWLIGVEAPSASLEFINKLQQINNEQANFIRLLVKNNSRMDQNRLTNDDAQLNNMSHLNNELVNLQRELAKKNAELARVNDMKNQFLGMAAHDVRNPLGVIISFSEFLIKETKDTLSEEHQNFLGMIHSSSVFLMNIIEDLLDISQIESGKLNLKLQETDFIQMAEQNVQLNNVLAAEKKVTVRLVCDQASIVCLIDKRKIEQVFNNLITNAVKFSYPESEVIVKIATNEQAVLVEVLDHGTGIPPDKIETIFQPFNKVSSSGTAGEKSTGLGLSIVRKIVEGHGGSISVESEPEKGSRFCFELPLKGENFL
jgi:signal transduction histidine kinase